MQECIQLLSNIFVQQKENEGNEPKQKQAIVPLANHGKESSVALKKKQVFPLQKQQSALTQDEEDFQKLLRASLTTSSVSSQQDPKSKGPACKEKTALASFVKNSHRNSKPSRSSTRRLLGPAKASHDFNHTKLIPKLFNESDTMNSKHDAQRSKEFVLATDRGHGARHSTLADMILPKSKFNPSKEQPKPCGPTKRVKQDLSDLKVFQQKCSDNNSATFQVYSRNTDKKHFACLSRDMRSSNDSLKRVVRQGLTKAKFVVLPEQVKRSAPQGQSGKVGSPADLLESPEAASSARFKSNQAVPESTAPIIKRGPVHDKQRSQTRVNSQQMNKIRYLF